MGAIQEVFVPDIGDFKEVDVVEVLVNPGDEVKPEQSLITVESDKATMEIPSSASGVVKELKVKVGDKVSQGTVIMLVEAGEAAAAKQAPAAAKAAEPAKKAEAPAPQPKPAAPSGETPP